MGSLSTARTFGGIGSLLVLLFVIPGIGAVLAIIGWILILFAVNHIADVYGDRSIFSDALIAALLAIAGIVVGAVVVFGSLLRFMGLNGASMFSVLGSHMFNSSALASGRFTGFGGLVVGALVGLALFWIFYTVSAFFLRRSFKKIAARFNIRWFNTAALLFLIGAALTIVVIGLVIVFIADIVMVVAFFSMPDDVSLQPPPGPMVIPPPPPGPVGMA